MRPLEHLLFPTRCAGCRITAGALCTDCRAECEPWLGEACLRCGTDRADRCFCPTLPDGVDSIRALWCYRGAPRAILGAAKERLELSRLWALRPLVTASLAAWIPPGAAIIPVPPDGRRLRRRGVDIPATLAAWAAGHPPIWRASRVKRGVLRRVGRAPRQVGLTRQERLATLAGQYRAHRSPPFVVLVDDVITTGATVATCATALAAAGANGIRVVSLLRTPSAPRDER